MCCHFVTTALLFSTASVAVSSNSMSMSTQTKLSGRPEIDIVAPQWTRSDTIVVRTTSLSHDWLHKVASRARLRQRGELGTLSRLHALGRAVIGYTEPSAPNLHACRAYCAVHASISNTTAVRTRTVCGCVSRCFLPTLKG